MACARKVFPTPVAYLSLLTVFFGDFGAFPACKSLTHKVGGADFRLGTDLGAGQAIRGRLVFAHVLEMPHAIQRR